jgi:hypothetical protein
MVGFGVPTWRGLECRSTKWCHISLVPKSVRARGTDFEWTVLRELAPDHLLDEKQCIGPSFARLTRRLAK